ncbi:hypothetical protein [Rhizosaccharibacter radicis]|uniref:Uncharacterized protein n=1 Tax=Rhizosaccharibacter radicis TaxID=2782605 RepID=A0ABT1VSL0_9PROT|nr:hypothetical protein [Acetobacteraceae bacterium KSS12]
MPDPFPATVPDGPEGAWHRLEPGEQMALARQALQQARRRLGLLAERLAEEIEFGHLPELGGVGALRLFRRLVDADDDPAPAEEAGGDFPAAVAGHA